MAQKIEHIIFAILFGLGAWLGVAAIVQVVAEGKPNLDVIAFIFGMLTCGMAYASGYQVFRFFVPNKYA